MKVIEPGHIYALDNFDVNPDLPQGNNEVQIVIYVKREGEGYPGNIGHHSGTIIQENLRSIIDRLKYVDNQIHDDGNDLCIMHARYMLYHLETRAAERHGVVLDGLELNDIETLPTGQNGHLLIGAGKCT